MIPTIEQQYNLVKQGLAKSVDSPCGKFVLFKYHRKVMFDNLWDTDPALMECRGHVYNKRTGQIQTLPPTKTFNYLENDTGANIDMEEQVFAYRKYNGFMAALSFTEDCDPIVTTTGSFTSDYVRVATEKLQPVIDTLLESNWAELYGQTFIYEILDQEFDPHIVDDGNGVHLLLSRNHEDGFQSPCGKVSILTLGQLLEKSKQFSEQHEGWMVYGWADDAQGNPKPFSMKLKTKYYSDKKKLMRKPNALESIANSDSFFAKVAQDVIDNRCFLMDDVLWKQQTDQQRRQVIERYSHDDLLHK
jgi:hypothetical protein